jgi:hypothetical protein
MKDFWLGAVILASVFAFTPTLAQAADSQGRYAVRGVGALTCHQLVSALDSKDEKIRREAVLLNASWLDGYLSFADRAEKGTFDLIPLTDTTVLLSMVVGQCRQHPESRVEVVSEQIIGHLARARVTEESPMVEVQVEGKKGIFRKATLIALQEALIKKGFLKGKADGTIDGKSQKALRAFQKAEKLKETGFPDAGTLLRALLN